MTSLGSKLRLSLVLGLLLTATVPLRAEAPRLELDVSVAGATLTVEYARTSLGNRCTHTRPTTHTLPCSAGSRQHPLPPPRSPPST